MNIHPSIGGLTYSQYQSLCSPKKAYDEKSFIKKRVVGPIAYAAKYCLVLARRIAYMFSSLTFKFETDASLFNRFKKALQSRSQTRLPAEEYALSKKLTRLFLINIPKQQVKPIQEYIKCLQTVEQEMPSPSPISKENQTEEALMPDCLSPDQTQQKDENLPTAQEESPSLESNESHIEEFLELMQGRIESDQSITTYEGFPASQEKSNSLQSSYQELESIMEECLEEPNQEKGIHSFVPAKEAVIKEFRRSLAMQPRQVSVKIGEPAAIQGIMNTSLELYKNEAKVKEAVGSLKEFIIYLSTYIEQLKIHAEIVQDKKFFKYKHSEMGKKNTRKFQELYQLMHSYENHIKTQLKTITPTSYQIQDLKNYYLKIADLLEQPETLQLLNSLSKIIAFKIPKKKPNNKLVKHFIKEKTDKRISIITTDSNKYSQWILSKLGEKGSQDLDFSPRVYCWQGYIRILSLLDNMIKKAAHLNHPDLQEALKPLQGLAQNLRKEMEKLNQDFVGNKW